MKILNEIQNISCVIVDDEPLARQVIREFLQKHPDISVRAEFGDPVEAYRQIRRIEPHLLFLDIQMPEMNGFELLEQLDNPPVIIFCTAYDEYAIKAFEANAIDYLLKPFDQRRFDRALEKARQFLSGENTVPNINQLLNYLKQERTEPSRLLVKKGGQLVMVTPQEIFWAEAQEDYSMLHTVKGNFLVTRSLRQLENRFTADIFLRVHRSALVNLQAVKEIHPWSSGRYLLILKNGERVQSSKSGAKLIKEMLL